MARYWCQRCKQESNTLDEPHLCKDLKKRYERNAKAVKLVQEVLDKWLLDEFADTEELAAEIVKALAGRDLGVD
jgi:transposase-like protein